MSLNGRVARVHNTRHITENSIEAQFQARAPDHVLQSATNTCTRMVVLQCWGSSA